MVNNINKIHGKIDMQLELEFISSQNEVFFGSGVNLCLTDSGMELPMGENFHSVNCTPKVRLKSNICRCSFSPLFLYINCRKWFIIRSINSFSCTLVPLFPGFSSYTICKSIGIIGKNMFIFIQ